MSDFDLMWINKYNDKGNIIEETSFYSSGKVEKKKTYKYDYDSDGNWLTKIEYHNDIPRYYYEREIGYYQSGMENLQNNQKSENVTILLQNATKHENKGNWSDSEYFYRRLFDIEPNNPQNYRALARVLLRQGKTEEAQKYFDKSKNL